MGISLGRSTVFMPDCKQPYPSILEFLVERFPQIPEATWLERISSGKILDAHESPIALTTTYAPNQRLFYFREVAVEPKIPFKEKIIYQDEHLLVACKPHFLPVTPGGSYVTETLLNRLQLSTGNPSLSPINRIDRGTAGLVLFSTDEKTRGLYQKLFIDGMVQKTYHAVVEFPNHNETEWLVENRIVKGEPWFRMQVIDGKINARSKVTLIKSKEFRALVELSPITGKKHQLRVHLSGLGMPIIGDRYYPDLLEQEADNYELPLQLLSKKIRFKNPINMSMMEFESSQNLTF